MAEPGVQATDEEAPETSEATEGTTGDGKRKWIVLALVLLLLAGGGAAGVLVLLGPSTESVEGEEPVVRQGPPIYYSLSPPFIVNFETQRRVRFLQIEMDVMTRDPDVIKALREHNPVLRNNIVLLLSGQKHEDLITAEGKERLRNEVLRGVQRTLREQVGRDGVEAVYFTSFVMQ